MNRTSWWRWRKIPDPFCVCCDEEDEKQQNQLSQNLGRVRLPGHIFQPTTQRLRTRANMPIYTAPGKGNSSPRVDFSLTGSPQRRTREESVVQPSSSLDTLARPHSSWPSAMQDMRLNLLMNLCQSGCRIREVYRKRKGCHPLPARHVDLGAKHKKVKVVSSQRWSLALRAS